MEEEYAKILSFNKSRERLSCVKENIKQMLERIKKKQDILIENLNLYISRDGEDNTHFGIDSFLFQTKIIELECRNLTQVYLFIKNRIYGSYYKLYNNIYNFLTEYHKEDCSILFNKIRNKEDYPVYQDLKYFSEYDQFHVSNIHDDIILFLIKIWNIIKNNNLEIEDEKKKIELGLNLDNYLSYNIYVNQNIINKLSFYTNILGKYHYYHITNLDNLYLKTKLIWDLLEKDIKIPPRIEPIEDEQLKKIILKNNDDTTDNKCSNYNMSESEEHDETDRTDKPNNADKMNGNNEIVEINKNMVQME